MRLLTSQYLVQRKRWPTEGRHILAQYDGDSVVVYQAYRPEIGHFAAQHGYFGGAFKLDRMSWIKPNFLWMMHRSGWGTKPGQEVTLAVRLKRDAFEHILSQAVHSSYVPEVYRSRADWQAALKSSDVRLQWDPDHSPAGGKMARRAVQLGLRGATLRAYARDWLLDIEDVSPFVAEQRANVANPTQLVTPTEEVYVPGPAPARRVGIEGAA